MIEIINLSKKFGDKTIFHNLNKKFQNGITCIMGSSGSGKTTLANILCGIINADSGEIKGVEKISIVFQEDRLLEHETVIKNMLFVSNKREYKKEYDKAEILIKKVGLEKELNKKVKDLSGGMKRRVAICRALMINYDTLILDEPFKGLDENIKKIVMDMIIEHSKEKIVLLITHDMREVEYMSGNTFEI